MFGGIHEPCASSAVSTSRPKRRYALSAGLILLVAGSARGAGRAFALLLLGAAFGWVARRSPRFVDRWCVGAESERQVQHALKRLVGSASVVRKQCAVARPGVTSIISPVADGVGLARPSRARSARSTCGEQPRSRAGPEPRHRYPLAVMPVLCVVRPRVGWRGATATSWSCPSIACLPYLNDSPGTPPARSGRWAPGGGGQRFGASQRWVAVASALASRAGMMVDARGAVNLSARRSATGSSHGRSATNPTSSSTKPPRRFSDSELEPLASLA